MYSPSKSNPDNTNVSTFDKPGVLMFFAPQNTDDPRLVDIMEAFAPFLNLYLLQRLKSNQELRRDTLIQLFKRK